ncbi:hypothetical protein ACFQ9Z_19400 [Streptomyces sp. NPDC056580]|uniref:DUF7919 family protein n=1 Tax=Streptomyces sp. NPDC056580 TaxID=3345872 RepID=UPI0036C6343E
MTHYDDLSEYTYFPDSVPSGVMALNIGWLDPSQEYTHGSTPDILEKKLEDLTYGSRQMKTRGWHRCQLPHANGEDPYPATVEISGTRIALGGAEIRVVAKSGNWLIAPDLILHYIREHSYKPPQEFITAVIDHRIAPQV